MSVWASLNLLGLGVSFAADMSESDSTSEILTDKFSDCKEADMGEKRRQALPAICFSFETCGLGFGLFTSASGLKQLGGRGLFGETTLSED